MGHSQSKLLAWQLLLASIGWAALTLTLLIILGIGLPVLLVSTLIKLFPGTTFLISTLAGALITTGALVLLGRETNNRTANQPSLRKALMSGFGLALLIGVPGLLLWFGYWLILSSA